MNEKRMAKVLATHAEAGGGVIGQQENMLGVQEINGLKAVNLTDEEHSRLAPLFQLTERLQQSMQPVKPSAAFARSLGKELVDYAKRQIMLTKRVRRAMLIGAAALGSLLSIASVVGAIVFVIARLRARAQARAIGSQHAPAGQTKSAPA